MIRLIFLLASLALPNCIQSLGGNPALGSYTHIYDYVDHTSMYIHDRESQLKLDRRIGRPGGRGWGWELFWFHFELPWINLDSLGCLDSSHMHLRHPTAGGWCGGLALFRDSSYRFVLKKLIRLVDSSY